MKGGGGGVEKEGRRCEGCRWSGAEVGTQQWLLPVVQHCGLSDGFCHVVHVVQGSYNLLRRAKPVQSSNLPHVCIHVITNQIAQGPRP